MRSDVARGDRALTRRTLLIAVLLFSSGAAAATYLYWPALRSYEVYRSDIRQAPHWAAYHSTSFAADDMLLEYARYNESPLQNAIYYVGTYVVDMVDLTKVLDDPRHPAGRVRVWRREGGPSWRVRLSCQRSASRRSL